MAAASRTRKRFWQVVQVIEKAFTPGSPFWEEYVVLPAAAMRGGRTTESREASTSSLAPGRDFCKGNRCRYPPGRFPFTGSQKNVKTVDGGRANGLTRKNRIGNN